MTNELIGDKIGLTHSAVSRIRRGERLPSIEVMTKIDTVFKWSVVDQIAERAMGARRYAGRFNEVVAEYFEERG